MKVVLISTYELGHQPFGLASPAAWLERSGAEVTCLDLSRQPFQENAVRAADVVAFYVPMHTATRLAIRLIEPVRLLNRSRAFMLLRFVRSRERGLFARAWSRRPSWAGNLRHFCGCSSRGLVSRTAMETARVRSARATGRRNPSIALERLQFIPPDRSQLAAPPTICTSVDARRGL